MNLLGMIIALVASFFLTIFVSVPIFQSMWLMLVFPYVKIILPPGIVMFALLWIGMIKYDLKEDGKKKLVRDYFTRILQYNIFICILWTLAFFYSKFI